MSTVDLSAIYRDYIACLNRQGWSDLGRFVASDVRHNGRAFGLAGYRAMLERDFDAIPDLAFTIRLLVTEPPHVAARLGFCCSPRGTFLDLPVDGRTVTFTENVFYTFRDGVIAEVRSIVDKVAIEEQLRDASRSA